MRQGSRRGCGYAGPFAGLDVEMRLCMALEDLWI